MPETSVTEYYQKQSRKHQEYLDSLSPEEREKVLQSYQEDIERLKRESNVRPQLNTTTLVKELLKNNKTKLVLGDTHKIRNKDGVEYNIDV